MPDMVCCLSGPALASVRAESDSMLGPATKRASIEGLKHNARLDLRLPDPLNDGSLACCRKEGVSSGEIVRSMILEYGTAQPRRLPIMAAGLKEAFVKRSKWIAGGIGGAAATGLAAMSLLFAPTASADDVDVEFALHFAEAARSSSIAGDYTIPLGEPMMIFADDPQLDADYGLIIKVSECPPQDQTARCELDWEIEIFEALDWHENELGGVSVTQKRVLATPQLSAERGGSVSFEIGAEGQDGAPLELISGEFMLRAEGGAP